MTLREVLEEFRRRHEVAEREGDTVRAGIYAAILEDLNAMETDQTPEWLSVQDAAARLGVSKHTLYRHPDQYPFLRNDGGRWRVDGRQFAQYLARHGSPNDVAA